MCDVRLLKDKTQLRLQLGMREREREGGMCVAANKRKPRSFAELSLTSVNPLLFVVRGVGVVELNSEVGVSH